MWVAAAAPIVDGVILIFFSVDPLNVNLLVPSVVPPLRVTTNDLEVIAVVGILTVTALEPSYVAVAPPVNLSLAPGDVRPYADYNVRI